MPINWERVPETIRTYKNQISATVKQSFEIKLTEVDDLLPWSSKAGGLPYLPKGADYPFHSNGTPLQLLAQINFADLPENDQYPAQGLLQFYIGGTDLYGCDFDDKQKQDGFRVIYFENVIEDESQLEHDFPEELSVYENGEVFNPFSGEIGIVFNATEQYIGFEDVGLLRKIFGVNNITEAEKLLATNNLYQDWLIPYSNIIEEEENHRLGGYPYFTQDDPRNFDSELQEYELLFQLDSADADGFGIMWGDMGIGNFFIHPHDLKNRDFSKVLYNWDCA